MSIGQRLEDEELSDVSEFDLFRVIGEHTTARLLDKRYTVNVEYDISFGAGNSIDRKIKYIDRTLYEEVMDNEFTATGLEPEQIVDLWLDHEHIEKCVVDGDNPVDAYYGGHRYGLRKEHLGLLVILGRDNALTKIKTYEKVIWPGLVRCYNRPVKKAPLDLWCAPLVDDPDERDEEIIKRLIKLGVKDATKRSKYETHYGLSGRPCRDCKFWAPEQMSQENGDLAICEIVTGFARENRHCDFFLLPGQRKKM